VLALAVSVALLVAHGHAAGARSEGRVCRRVTACRRRTSVVTGAQQGLRRMFASHEWVLGACRNTQTGAHGVGLRQPRVGGRCYRRLPPTAVAGLGLDARQTAA
jgi:hypothetical protein